MSVPSPGPGFISGHLPGEVVYIPEGIPAPNLKKVLEDSGKNFNYLWVEKIFLKKTRNNPGQRKTDTFEDRATKLFCMTRLKLMQLVKTMDNIYEPFTES